MSKIALTLAAGLLALWAKGGDPAEPRLVEVSDHTYVSQGGAAGLNVGAVVTGQGVLIVDPPSEEDLPPLLASLKRISPAPVRWVVCTSYRRALSSGVGALHRGGAAILSTKALDDLAWGEPPRRDMPPDAADRSSRFGLTPRFLFDRQMRLFPEGVEVRIMALSNKAHTAGDIVVLVPDEKVLMVGGLFAAGRFPDIDSQAGGGSADGWIDGVRQVIRAVPLLKSAMPEPKPDPDEPPPEEKTLEELVTVIPGMGPLSNLQEMKDLHDLAVELRRTADRALRNGRSLKSFLSLASLSEQRALANFESFATELFQSLANNQ